MQRAPSRADLEQLAVRYTTARNEGRIDHRAWRNLAVAVRRHARTHGLTRAERAELFEHLTR